MSPSSPKPPPWTNLWTPITLKDMLFIAIYLPIGSSLISNNSSTVRSPITQTFLLWSISPWFINLPPSKTLVVAILMYSGYSPYIAYVPDFDPLITFPPADPKTPLTFLGAINSISGTLFFIIATSDVFNWIPLLALNPP